MYKKQNQSYFIFTFSHYSLINKSFVKFMSTSTDPIAKNVGVIQTDNDPLSSASFYRWANKKGKPLFVKFYYYQVLNEEIVSLIKKKIN